MNEKQIKEAMMKELVTDALEVDCSTDIPDFWDCLADHLIRKGWRKECYGQQRVLFEVG